MAAEWTDEQWATHYAGQSEQAFADMWDFDAAAEEYCDRSTWAWSDYVTRGPYCASEYTNTQLRLLSTKMGDAAEMMREDMLGAAGAAREDLKELAWMQLVALLGIVAALAYVLPSFAGTGFQVGRR